MPESNSYASVFAVGGAVQASGGVYLSRAADEELLALCRAGDFGYVLTPRQLGKSSLMVRTAERLEAEGVRSAVIDLSLLGTDTTADAWYLGLLVAISDSLGLEVEVEEWWHTRASQSAAHRMTSFFKEVLLKEIGERVVVFVDEIDTTLSLSFTDDFYAAIRYFYNARAHTRAFRRLSFVLIGVATPGDLIRDPQRTPFNIGRRVDLVDFTFEQALPLAAGFGLPEEEARRVLGWVLWWTGGHPYLTQRLCRAIADEGRVHWTEEGVTRLVSDVFFGEMSEKDNNIQFVRDMLTKRAPDLAGVLDTYRRILRGTVRDEEQSAVKSHLKLSGVVRREGVLLRVRNPIYHKVFDEKWIRAHLPINWLRTLTRVAAGILLAIMVLAIPLAAYAWSQKAKAEAAFTREKVARQALEAANLELNRLREKEVEARERAEESARSAREAEARALAAKGEVEDQRRLAEEARVEAEKQARLAQESERAALGARQDALEQRARAERLSEIALSSNLGALAEVTGGQQARLLQQSVMLARESVARSPKAPPIIGYQALRDGLSLLPLPENTRAGGPSVERVLFSDDGNNFMAVGVEIQQPEVSRPRRVAADVRQAEAVRNYSVYVFDARSRMVTKTPERKYPVNETLIGPDGEFLVSRPDENSALSVTELSSGKITPAFSLAKGASLRAVSSDRRHFATLNANGTVQVLGPSGEKIGPALVSGSDPANSNVVVDPNSLRISPDGKFVTIAHHLAATEKRVWATTWWDVATGAHISVGEPTTAKPSNVLFSNNGKYLAAISDQSVRVYNTSSVDEIWSAGISNVDSAAAAFSPDSFYLAVNTEPNVVRVLSANDGDEVASLDHDGPVVEIRFSSDGRYIATNGTGVVRVWTWREESLVEVARAIHEANVTDFNLSPDGSLLLTVVAVPTPADGGGEPQGQPARNLLKVWDLSGRRDSVRRTLEEPITGAALSPDKKRLLAVEEVGDNVTLRVWGAAEGHQISSAIKLPSRDQAFVVGDPYPPPTQSFNGKYLVEIESGDPADVHTRAKVWDVDNRNVQEIRLAGTLKPPVVVSEDGKLLAATQAVNRSTAVLVFDIATGREVARVSEPDIDDLDTIAFSPDGEYLALTGGEGGPAFVWDLKEGRAATRFETEEMSGIMLFSSSGKYLVYASGGVQLWQRDAAQPVTLERAPRASKTTDTTEPRDVFEESLGDVHDIAFSADEKYVAAGSSDGLARVWETATGRLVASLKFDGAVYGVTLSQHGEYIAAMGEGTSARVWRVTDGVEVARIPHGSVQPVIDHITFSPDDRYLLTAGASSGKVEVWLWRPEDLLELSCKLVTITEPGPDKWREYLGEELATYFLSARREPCRAEVK